MSDEIVPRVISAREALQCLRERSNVDIPELPKTFDKLPPVRIFNVHNKLWTVPKGGLGTFTIPPCEDWADTSRPLDIPMIVKETIPVGENLRRPRTTTFEWRFYDGREVAEDIVGCGRFLPQAQALTRWGVFIAKGQKPTRAEIEEARARILATYKEQVVLAESFWAANQPREIQQLHREAYDYVRAHELPGWYK